MSALAALPEVEVAKLDQKWLERLYAILAIIERAAESDSPKAKGKAK